MVNFSNVSTIKQLSSKIHVSLKCMYKYLNEKNINIYYSCFYIPKKNNEKREILAPTLELKIIQKRINKIIYNIYFPNEKSRHFAHAFVKKRSIISNAKMHNNKKYIIRVDINGFFDNINFGRVLYYFRKNNVFNFSKEVSFAITKIACCNNRLPQGSPLSPTISNLIGEIIDFRI